MSGPVDVYPSPVMKSQSNSFHSISNGSYGLAFIVLAAIFVVSVAACIFGRKRNGGSSNEKEVEHDQQPPPPPPPQQPKANGGAEMGPKEWEGAKVEPRIDLRERGDIEHGFGRGIPPPRFDGGWRPEVRFSGNV